MRNLTNTVTREDRGDSPIFNNISITKTTLCYFKKMGLVEWERRGGKRTSMVLHYGNILFHDPGASYLFLVCEN